MDELRFTAAYFVKESTMTKAAKLQMMNFLQNEATDAQVMALLLDGEIQTLDEMAEIVVYDRFDAALLDEGKIGKAISAAKKGMKYMGSEFKRGYKTVKGAKASGVAAAKSKGLSKKASKKHGTASALRAHYKNIAPGDKKGQRFVARFATKHTRKLPFGKSAASRRASKAMAA